MGHAGEEGEGTAPSGSPQELAWRLAMEGLAEQLGLEGELAPLGQGWELEDQPQSRKAEILRIPVVLRLEKEA